MVDVYDTKTDRRQKKARKSIRPYVSNLLAQIGRGEPLTERQVEWLYCDLRAYHRSKRPFRKHMSNAVRSVGFDLDMEPGPILARLLDFEKLDKYYTCRLACSLLVAVSEDVRSEAALA